MPQYKDKKENVDFDLGILLYPALMAADIMINDPDVIIIGRDQVPHIELCNDISKRFSGKNYKYEFGDLDKVMSLINPDKKMSKSLGEAHVLHLFEEDYHKKLIKANSNEVGLINLKNIAIKLNVNPDDFVGNYDLKIAMIDRMKQLFS